MYAGVDSVLPNVPFFAPLGDAPKTRNYKSHVTSAFITGCIFKSVAGLRPELIMGTLLASVVGSYGFYEMVRDGEIDLAINSPNPVARRAVAA